MIYKDLEQAVKINSEIKESSEEKECKVNLKEITNIIQNW